MLRFLLLLLLAGFASAEVPHVNWENHPVHPIALSPDGTLLAATHTADARLQLFDVSTGRPVPVGHVPVGIDPVSVRFRNDREAWVVNHLSDSISVVDVRRGAVLATLRTRDEPFDLVFAGEPAFAWVSSSQTNTIQRFSIDDFNAPPLDIPIAGEDPRALGVSPNGRTVYAAIFESGNGTTVLRGALAEDVVNDLGGPYGGANPPPNVGDALVPGTALDLPPPPTVGLIVRKDQGRRWRDDNGRDWTRYVSGAQAGVSGRIVGWDLPDRDLAAIDTEDRSVRYARGLMNLAMALAVNPASGEVTMVGTDARNEIRFEPNVRGIFATVELTAVDPGSLAGRRSDLNPHLDYTSPRVPRAERERSVGDPRAVIWTAAGDRGFVAGMGSNNVVTIDRAGRVHDAAPIEVGDGPAGLALSGDEQWLYVWNHFEASVSTVRLVDGVEIDRVAAFDPLPEALREGRRFLYDTHEGSGLGHLSCATCHVDGRTDRLAWDLGDPAGAVVPFDQNCAPRIPVTCSDHHPMKGPMLTQTLQDIIGKEPFHWRGDLPGLEAFNRNFPLLQAADELSAEEMARFEAFLATIALPPNPFRALDNALESAVDLSGLPASRRFGPPGRSLGTGNARAGLQLFRNELFSALGEFNAEAECALCHSLPTGFGVNGPLRDPRQNFFVFGGREIPTGPNGENHLMISSFSTEQRRTFKIPSLRTLYDRTGFDLSSTESRAGFGFLHDGSVDSLASFVSLEDFRVTGDQQIADLVAFLVSFSGSDLPLDNPGFTVDPPLSNDTHAAVGQQETFPRGDRQRLNRFLALAESGRVALVAARRNGTRGTTYLFREGVFHPDDDSAGLAPEDLRRSATGTDPVTFTVVPAGLGERFGLDRDGDGVPNGVEVAQGSDPANAASTTFSPIQGLWFNPARSGHGIDLQRAGDLLAATWYTYETDGTPTWYQAVDTFTGTAWTAPLLRFTGDPAGAGVEGETVGEISFTFSDARNAEFCWTLSLDARSSQADRKGQESSCEPFERFAFASGVPAPDVTGLWFDPGEPGYGLSIDSQGGTRVVVVYYYDADLQPRWVIGQSSHQGGNETSSRIEMLSFEGFCPGCGVITTDSEVAGSLDLEFEDYAPSARAGALSFSVTYPGDDSRFERSDVPLVPLTNVPVSYGR